MSYYSQWMFRSPRRRLADFAKKAAHLIPRGTRRLLDIGCGDGVLLSELATLLPQAQLVGVDLSVPSIRLARETCSLPCVSFIEADYMSFDEQCFDAIVSYSTINLLPIDRDKLLEKISDDLEVGGLFVVSMPDDCMHNRFLIIFRRFLGLIRSGLLDTLIFQVGRLVTPRDVPDEQIFQNVGYMYIVPHHTDGHSFRKAAHKAGLEFVHAEREHSPSLAKLRHNTIVFRKRRS